MAILQVRDVDENLYKSLKARAKREKRSVSQEVTKIIEEYLAQPDNTSKINPTEEFLKLAWNSDADENADNLIREFRNNRNQGNQRLEDMKDVFD